jgi:nucleoside 2-deoxyribosyltransferase
MKQKTVLVGGPIQYALNENGSFDKRLKSQIDFVLNTLANSNHRIFSAHKEEQFGKIDMIGKSALICKRDFNWMKQCDVFVCILPVMENGVPYRSDGTCIELGWASALGKKTIILKNMSDGYSHLITGLSALSDVTYLNMETCLQSPSLLLESISAHRV